MNEEHRAAWLFPAPIRRSRFAAAAADWNEWNVEVAPDRVKAFSFSRRADRHVLYFDYQTQLDDNYPGRHGSGRGGVYRGFYLKGVGRTPAAANWNQGDERYHGSGHMSAGSAAREYLITAFLRRRGLQDTIVPCEAVLAGRLRPDERRAVAVGHTSARADHAPADARLMTLTAKPADFARMSNFVWALDHFSCKPDRIGTLFVDLERYLHPPGYHGSLDGEPAAIAAAMDAAFLRGLDRFRKWAAAGVFWIFTQNNFTLDGRYLDLETPLVLGTPFVGLLDRWRDGGQERQLLGYEEFWFVWYWRLFLARVKERLRFLTARGVLPDRNALLFLREMARQIDTRFTAKHLLYSDATLARQSADRLGKHMDVGAAGKRALRDLAEWQLPQVLYSSARKLPELKWNQVSGEVLPPFTGRFEIQAPGFLDAKLAAAAEDFAGAVRRVEACREPGEFLRELEQASSSLLA